MKSIKKNTLQFYLIIILISLAESSSSQVNKLDHTPVKLNNTPAKEEESDDLYLVKNDGTKIHGDRIKNKSGLLVKDQISIDDEKFAISEIKGYRGSKAYYARIGNVYAQRIIHGKMNVYVLLENSSASYEMANGSRRLDSYGRIGYYSQKGDDGPLVGFVDPSDIRQLLNDCPLSVEMLNMSNLQTAVKKKDVSYFNKVFDIYNNNCKPIE